MDIPDELKKVQSAARGAIRPIRPDDDSTIAAENFLLTAQQTRAGRDLPDYFLVYFLLVDLLGFRNLGRFEKVAWSIPIDFCGRAFLIEYRKFGLGLFAQNAQQEESDARDIVSLISKGVEVARPFFEWLAEEATKDSSVNVINKSDELFNRYKFFSDQFIALSQEAQERSEEKEVTTGENAFGTWTTYHYPALELRQKARWLAQAAIEAFFGWTEHVFIHLAILQGKLNSAKEVARLAGANWSTKYQNALDIEDPDAKRYYDRLLLIRRQMRNYLAHGAFGKRGEAFKFHSKTGAVPVLLDEQPEREHFFLTAEAEIKEAEALREIEAFIKFLWSNDREAAKILIQDSQLPMIFSMVKDGSYEQAIQSTENMHAFIERLNYEVDRAANMDW